MENDHQSIYNPLEDPQGGSQEETSPKFLTGSTSGVQVGESMAYPKKYGNGKQAQVSVGHVNNLMIGNHNRLVVTSSPNTQKGFSSNAKSIPAKYPLTTSQQPLSLDQKLDIKDKVGGQWKDLGRRLGFGEPVLEQMEMENRNNCSEIVYQILTKWQQRFVHQATQESLAIIFHKMRRGDLSDLLREST